MSELAEKTFEYLKNTGARPTKYFLRTKFGVRNSTMTAALEELSGRIHNTIDGGGRVYFYPTATPEAATKNVFSMKPYIPPASLVQRKREIEAQRAEFPSKFN